MEDFVEPVLQWPVVPRRIRVQRYEVHMGVAERVAHLVEHRREMPVPVAAEIDADGVEDVAEDSREA